MSFQLVVTAGPDQGRTFTLQAGPDQMLGRGQASLYHLSDPRVSRAHCQILLEGDRATVIDNGGSGGTAVNGKPVTRHLLRLGDVLQVGDTQLRLHMGDFPLDVALGAIEKKPAPAAEAPRTDRLQALSGQKLAHYDIGPVIGQGSTSVVFVAEDAQHRSLALKVLLPQFSKDEEEVQRFVRAMKTMMPLRHPNLVALYGAGKTGPYCWVAMEYVAGENMAQAIERIGIAGMLDWPYAFRVAVHVGRALAYAHGQHIIHRNVTPKNILLQATDKVVKLGDLMLAKALEGALARQITRPGELVGEVAYMSPERTRGMGGVDGRSDIYGLGATVYALLTGRPPFGGDTLIEKITRIRQTEPVRPTKYQLGIPAAFEGAVLKMLAKQPEDRYQTAGKLVHELERIGNVHGVTA
ncbi:MAG TPA: FHA domain-containing serine/threonine-protein kinase [Gemmataceae bacterium]|jgi:serine/threonine protein kinase|nr:FHA domain-containing serine/threonine-protein kinase [Gemmataceae bacterium]